MSLVIKAKLRVLYVCSTPDHFRNIPPTTFWWIQFQEVSLEWDTWDTCQRVCVVFGVFGVRMLIVADIGWTVIKLPPANISIWRYLIFYRYRALYVFRWFMLLLLRFVNIESIVRLYYWIVYLIYEYRNKNESVLKCNHFFIN